MTGCFAAGSKADIPPSGQAAVLPSSDARNSGSRALLEGTHAGLLRPAALPSPVLQQVADRFHSSRSAQRTGHGSAELANGPDDIRDLHRERGLISRFHTGRASGRDCPLDFMTRPTKHHTLAGPAIWTTPCTP